MNQTFHPAQVDKNAKLSDIGHHSADPVAFMQGFKQLQAASLACQGCTFRKYDPIL